MNSTYLMGADPKDFDRSSVAQNIFSLAHKNNMHFAHYEYRWPVPSPEAWLREDHGQGEVYWENGVLAELKYQSFRHDSSVCNFHPGQSSKWGAHELCHKLVGYAWKENADLLFHVLAAWTAEILPVTVYYFWDEVDCHKCEKHEDFSHSPISYCHDCEAVSRTRSNSEELSRIRSKDDRDTDLIQRGWDFLNEQLRAVEKSLKEQRLVTAPYYHLDLADDAYFYIQQQVLRLNSPIYADYMAHVPKDSMYVSTVEGLIHRVRQVAKAIMGEAALEPLGITKEKWVSLDVGFRGLELAEVLEGEAQKQLQDITFDYLSSLNLAGYISAYKELMKEITLPEAEEFFATGYDLEEGLGYNSLQILEGIQSLAPMYFEKKGERHFSDFIANDRGNRKYLGQRLVDFFKDPGLEIEVFLNQPRSFFKKYYSLELDGLYTWSDRVRFCENTDNLKELLGIDSPYFMLFKKSSDEVLSQPIEKKRYLQYCAIRNTSFSLSDLTLDLDERNFYVQNHILVQTK